MNLTSLIFTMQHSNPPEERAEEVENKNYADKVRSNMETQSMQAIMGRFIEAVTWREHDE